MRIKVNKNLLRKIIYSSLVPEEKTVRNIADLVGKENERVVIDLCGGRDNVLIVDNTKPGLTHVILDYKYKNKDRIHSEYYLRNN